MKKIVLISLITLTLFAVYVVADLFDEKSVTETTPHNVDTVPEVQLITEAGTQTGNYSSYCWGGLCIDGIPVVASTSANLIVTDEESIEYSILAENEPEYLELVIQEPVYNVVDWPNSPETITVERTTLAPAFTGVFQNKLEPGKYTLILNGTWEDGDVSTYFSIEVR